MLKKLHTSNAPEAIGPYSQAIIINHLLFSSGQIPLDPDSGAVIGKNIVEQTEQVMKNLAAILNAAGSSFQKVVKTTCFLSDMQDFSAFNEVYAKYFSEHPARSCFSVKELPKNVLVEVELIAEC